MADARARPRPHHRRGARPRPRQRRPRPPGRLLHGVPGDPRLPGVRLRPALRLRHLPPGARRRLAARGSRHLAQARVRLGDLPARPDGAGADRRRGDPGAARGRHAGRTAGPTPASSTVCPYDVLVAGFGTSTVSILRLWKAEAPDEFDFEIFSQGDFLRAVAGRERAEAITKVLYPSDEAEAGRELRLHPGVLPGRLLGARRGASASAAVTARAGSCSRTRWRSSSTTPTRPSTVAELMRFFVDEAGLAWERAWRLTRADLRLHQPHPAARGARDLAGLAHAAPDAAPRRRSSSRSTSAFSTRSAPRCPGDLERLRRVSLVHEEGERRFRMAHLAIVGCHRVNGVARLHTDLLRKHVVRDFAELWPERFVSITNGITPRRWLLSCNPRLSRRHHRAHRRRVDARPRAPAEPAAVRRRPRPSRSSSAPSSGPTRCDLAARIDELCGVDGRPGLACSTCRSSGCTSTSGSCSTPCTSSRCTCA